MAIGANRSDRHLNQSDQVKKVFIEMIEKERLPVEFHLIAHNIMIVSGLGFPKVKIY